MTLHIGQARKAKRMKYLMYGVLSLNNDEILAHIKKIFVCI